MAKLLSGTRIYGNATIDGNLLMTGLSGSTRFDLVGNLYLSNTGTVNSIIQTATGNLYTSSPTVTFSAPTGANGVTATANANIGVVFVSNIVSGGVYYTPGQILTMVGNASTFANATFTVAGVGNVYGGTGNVTGLIINSTGSYNIANINPVSFTVASGSGTGLLVNLTYGVNQPVITNAGLGYVEPPTITISGGGGTGANAYAIVGSSTNITSAGTNLSIVLPQGEVMKFVSSNVILGLNYGNIGGNVGVVPYATPTLSATALTGNAIAAGGMGIVGNIYGTSRIGYTWVSNSSSAAFTQFNPATNSIDTYFA